MIDTLIHLVLLCAAQFAAYQEALYWYSGPHDPGALYSSTAERFGHNINMRMQEVERRPKTSVVRVFSQGHGSGLGAAIYGHRTALELAALRGFRYAVVLEASEGITDLRFAYGDKVSPEYVELTLGFADNPEPDAAAEFPEHAASGVGMVYRREDLDWLREPRRIQVRR